MALSEAKSNVSDAIIVAGAKAGGEIAKLKAVLAKKKMQRDAMMAKSGCKKPMINIGRKKREYLACIQDFNRGNLDAKRAQLEYRLAEKKLESATALQLQRAKNSPKKFLGMPQGVGLLVFGLGVSALMLGSLYIYKKHIGRLKVAK